jgi:hypothetical protein
LLASDGGPRDDEGHDVLKLVPEPVGPAGGPRIDFASSSVDLAFVVSLLTTSISSATRTAFST